MNQVENNGFLERERKCKPHDGDEWCARQKRVDTSTENRKNILLYFGST